MHKEKKKVECTVLEVFGPDMSCQTEASAFSQQSWSQSGKRSSPFLVYEWFLFSRAKTKKVSGEKCETCVPS